MKGGRNSYKKFENKNINIRNILAFTETLFSRELIFEISDEESYK